MSANSTAGFRSLSPSRLRHEFTPRLRGVPGLTLQRPQIAGGLRPVAMHGPPPVMQKNVAQRPNLMTAACVRGMQPIMRPISPAAAPSQPRPVFPSCHVPSNPQRPPQQCEVVAKTRAAEVPKATVSREVQPLSNREVSREYVSREAPLSNRETTMQTNRSNRSKESVKDSTRSSSSKMAGGSYVDRLKEAQIPVGKSDYSARGKSSLANTARLKFSHAPERRDPMHPINVASPQRKFGQQRNHKKLPSSSRTPSPTSSSATLEAPSYLTRETSVSPSCPTLAPDGTYEIVDNYNGLPPSARRLYGNNIGNRGYTQERIPPSLAVQTQTPPLGSRGLRSPPTPTMPTSPGVALTRQAFSGALLRSSSNVLAPLQRAASLSTFALRRPVARSQSANMNNNIMTGGVRPPTGLCLPMQSRPPSTVGQQPRPGVGVASQPASQPQAKALNAFSQNTPNFGAPGNTLMQPAMNTVQHHLAPKLPVQGVAGNTYGTAAFQNVNPAHTYGQPAAGVFTGVQCEPALHTDNNFRRSHTYPQTEKEHVHAYDEIPECWEQTDAHEDRGRRLRDEGKQFSARRPVGTPAIAAAIAPPFR